MQLVIDDEHTHTWPCSTRHDGTTRSTKKSPTRTRHGPMILGPGLARPAAQAVLGLTPKPVGQHGPARKLEGGPTTARGSHRHPTAILAHHQPSRPHPAAPSLHIKGTRRGRPAPPHLTLIHSTPDLQSPPAAPSRLTLRRAAVSSASDLIVSGDLDLPSAVSQPFPSPP
jgi:hypothetical protein